MVAGPVLTPVTRTGATGAVWPAAIVTVAGTVTRPMFELLRVTIRPPNGAGDVSVIGSTAVWPSSTATGWRLIMPGGATVTFAMASGIPEAFAVMMTLPGDTPVITTLAVVLPAAKVTVAGTLATFGLLEESATTRLVGVALVNDSVTLCVAVPVMFTVCGVNANPKPTRTLVVAVASPLAVAVTVVVPAAIPFRRGCNVGVVWPGLMKMFCWESVAVAVSVTESNTKVACAAGAAKVTGNCTKSPGGTIRFWARMMSPDGTAVTVILAVACP